MMWRTTTAYLAATAVRLREAVATYPADDEPVRRLTRRQRRRSLRQGRAIERRLDALDRADWRAWEDEQRQ